MVKFKLLLCLLAYIIFQFFSIFLTSFIPYFLTFSFFLLSFSFLFSFIFLSTIYFHIIIFTSLPFLFSNVFFNRIEMFQCGYSYSCFFISIYFLVHIITKHYTSGHILHKTAFTLSQTLILIQPWWLSGIMNSKFK